MYFKNKKIAIKLFIRIFNLYTKSHAKYYIIG